MTRTCLPNPSQEEASSRVLCDASPQGPALPHPLARSCLRAQSARGSILNVDQERERCAVKGLNDSDLRRVSFRVDVEIAPHHGGGEGGDSAEKRQRNKDKKLKERAEGEALKHPSAIEDVPDLDKPRRAKMISQAALFDTDFSDDDKPKPKSKKSSSKKPKDSPPPSPLGAPENDSTANLPEADAAPHLATSFAKGNA
ncbi:hypothetical protein MRB53_037543 [Persea americana]|nr:hypothetical protein MRB53_037543 [Persea americana]